MCGITGFIDYNNKSTIEDLQRMVSTLHHRGPNDDGVKLNQAPDLQIGLGQARLSIIDLSNGGHQPMVYRHLSIVFNGEIYNYKEIREDLRGLGHHFVTESDTEVIIHAYAEWGKSAVNRFIGMFVYVIYDSIAQQVIITRDRAGVKPLFYYWKEGLLLFSSELKTFHVHKGFVKKIDQKALRGYFDFGYIAAPNSIFENTHKLLPGHHLIFNLQSRSFNIELFWEINNFYKQPKFQISYDDAKNKLHELLKSACEYRMVADVPVGVFLSGGYDSTAVTAILQANRQEQLKTFTIGFEEGNNEVPFAKETAKYLGTDHTEFICRTREAQAIIPTLPFYYDEPFADSSAIPTILVSELARQKVTVALSADAGDEVFAGYTSYSDLKNKLELLNRVPDLLKPFAGKVTGFASKLVKDVGPLLEHKLWGISKSIHSNRLKQSADLFRSINSLPESYQKELFAVNVNAYPSGYLINTIGFQHEIEIAMAIDFKMYLQNDILTKVDRATMSVSLEGREPLLDHRLVEFAAQLPFDYKYDGNSLKKILKSIVHEYIPKSMMDRPKAGFSLPIYNWLLGDLAYLIEEYLNEKAIAESGLFRTEFVIEQVHNFKKGKLHFKSFIWKMLMFQMWYHKWMKV